MFEVIHKMENPLNVLLCYFINATYSEGSLILNFRHASKISQVKACSFFTLAYGTSRERFEQSHPVL